MAEWKLFDGDPPEYTTVDWYAYRDHAPHLEEEGHRPRLLASAGMVAHAAFMWGLTTVVDLGAGDGGLLSLLGPALKGWGYDLAPANVEAARLRGVDVRYGDALGDAVEYGDIAVATEFFEHLVEPHQAAATIAGRCRALVASSPRVETDKAHYEFHTWAWDMPGYAAMLQGAGWRIVRHEPVGAFQIVLAESLR